MGFDDVQRKDRNKDAPEERGYDSPRALRRSPRTGKLTDPSEPLEPTKMVRDPKTGKLIDADFLP